MIITKLQRSFMKNMWSCDMFSITYILCCWKTFITNVLNKQMSEFIKSNAYKYVNKP